MAQPQTASAPSGHGLLCPTCRVDLVMSDRQGIEIDYCPKCRGVWLDRGELDKIIERSLPTPTSPFEREAPRNEGRPQTGHSRDRHDDDQRYGGSHGRRRESFLSRLFDD